jgi:hypothetical protein
MVRRHFLLGISISALAASAAGAQTSSDASGNTKSVQCSPTSACAVDNQATGNERNSGVIEAIGEEHDASIVQRGDDSSSTIEIDGNRGSVEHEQQGDRLTSRTIQAGDDHDSRIFQSGQANSASVSQSGAGGNSSDVIQGSFFGLTTPHGRDNVVSVTQNGTNLASSVSQHTSTSPSSPASSNSATVVQMGAGSTSNIGQYSSGNSAVVRIWEGGLFVSPSHRADNVSNVFQSNTSALTSVPSNHFADVAILGQQNESHVSQSGSNHRAIVSMLGGGAGTTGSAPTDPTGEGRTVPADRGLGNSSRVEQVSGSGLFFEISVGGAASATTPRGQGNQTLVQQNGTNHRATVYQRGLFDGLYVNQRNNTATSAQTTANTSGTQGDAKVDVSQLSFNSSTRITQAGTNTAIVTQGVNRNNAAGTPTEVGGNNVITIDQMDAGDIVSGGGSSLASNFVEVAQYGRQNSTTVSQAAVNARAIVFQRVGSRANSVNIQQGTNEVLGPSAPGQGADAVNLAATVTQSGRGSSARVAQVGINQTAGVTQTGNIESASSANVVSVLQANANNLATITQNGNNLTATSDQRGAGTASRRNSVTVEQTGDRHRATARQEAGVTASGDTAPASGDPSFPGARGAGAQSAEIQIIQQGARAAGDTTSAGNSATVTQQGAGQFARIFQDGRANTAGILQGPSATNATAIIEQSGDGNSFFITQNAAGQYMRVVQNGNSNIISNQAAGPANSGGGVSPGGTGSTTAQPPVGGP